MKEANGPLTTRHAGLRVAFVGIQGSQWLGQSVDATVLDPANLPAAMTHVEESADLVVVDHDPGRGWSGRLGPLLERARKVSVPIVGIDGPGRTPWAGREFLRIGSRPSPASVLVGPTIDPRVNRPRNLRRSVGAAGVLAVDRPPQVGPRRLRNLVGPWLRTADSVVLPWAPEPGIDGGMPIKDGSGPELETDPGSVVVVTMDGHASPWSLATHIAEISAAGLAVIAPGNDTQDLGGLIPSGLLASLATPMRLLQDAEERERLAVVQRRSVFQEMAGWARWDRLRDAIGLPRPSLPSITVVLSTRRREFLAHALEQVERQTYPNLDLVLVLHGSDWPSRLSELEGLGMPTTVVRVSGSASFGDALNEGSRAATGDFISKMDDDDWYAAAHIWDLVVAYEHAESQIVGKAAEWMYLRDLDITVRRFADGAEWPSRTIAGGTLLLLRDDLRRVGGWRSIGQAVDQALIGDVLDAGGTSFRTHGYGYVLHRHDKGHTWSIELDYLLRDNAVQFRGLRLDAALVSEPGSDAPASVPT